MPVISFDQTHRKNILEIWIECWKYVTTDYKISWLEIETKY